jgi:hypothetical protein
VRAGPVARYAWFLPLLFPLGFFTWAGFLYAGLRVRQMRWVGIAVASFVLLVIGGFLLTTNPEEGQSGSRIPSDIGVAIVLLLWGGGFAYACAIRKEFIRRLELRLRTEDHQIDRRIATDLIESSPEEAVRLGVGRPDLPDAHDGGLVDVNHAPVRVLALLPGIGDGTAARIVAAREELGPFSSIAELGMVMELPASTVEKLRPLVVFLP